MLPTPTDPVSASFQQAVQQALDAFLDAVQPRPEQFGPALASLMDLIRGYLRGGKRLRPAFAVWGHVAVRPPRDESALVRAAASFELLHASLLVHDDLIDDSATRRGLPAAHRSLAGWYARRPRVEATGSLVETAVAETTTAADRFGTAAGIILGDLLAAWSVEMVETSGIDANQLSRARPHLHRMRSEVNLGQYLDLLAEHGLAGTDQAVVARHVATLKTSAYTVARPLAFGAALAGADDRLQRSLAAYGRHLGLAFQYRDDLLGVFGDAQQMGKPAGDDLREGKRTLLIVEALASPASQGLAELLGRPDLDEDGIARAQEFIASSGAPQRVEQRIDEAFGQAVASLDDAELTSDGLTALRGLARMCAYRDS